MKKIFTLFVALMAVMVAHAAVIGPDENGTVKIIHPTVTQISDYSFHVELNGELPEGAKVYLSYKEKYTFAMSNQDPQVYCEYMNSEYDLMDVDEELMYSKMYAFESNSFDFTKPNAATVEFYVATEPNHIMAYSAVLLPDDYVNTNPVVSTVDGLIGKLRPTLTEKSEGVYHIDLNQQLPEGASVWVRSNDYSKYLNSYPLDGLVAQLEQILLGVEVYEVEDNQMIEAGFKEYNVASFDYEFSGIGAIEIFVKDAKDQIISCAALPVNREEETTAIDGVKSADNSAAVKKYIENGRLVIEKSGKKFNAAGGQIK